MLSTLSQIDPMPLRNAGCYRAEVLVYGRTRRDIGVMNALNMFYAALSDDDYRMSLHWAGEGERMLSHQPLP